MPRRAPHSHAAPPVAAAADDDDTGTAPLRHTAAASAAAVVSESKEQAEERYNRTHTPMRIAFLHPNLGIGQEEHSGNSNRTTRRVAADALAIRTAAPPAQPISTVAIPPSLFCIDLCCRSGGAERLVVDCASALQQRGHRVQLFTNYHDPSHCYEETRDGTLSVLIYGLTRDSLFGRFHVLIASLRMLWLALVFALGYAREFDVVFVDQVSLPVPFLRWFTRCRVMFYCHFPDKLLSRRGGLFKRLYRLPMDALEEWSTGQADLIVVNSLFTRRTFAASFRSLAARVNRGEVQVLYPSIDFQRYKTLDSLDELKQEAQKKEVRLLEQVVYGAAANAAAQASSSGSASKSRRTSSPRRSSNSSSTGSSAQSRPKQVHLLTSINRFERKKNLPLAIRAFHLLSRRSFASSSSSSTPALSMRLMVCGGYDPVNAENREHFEELRALCEELDMRPVEMLNVKSADGNLELRWADEAAGAGADHKPIVYFLRSFTDLQRAYLLSHSLCVLYTPSDEHFGIVPVEAMYMRRPVLACNSGGPLETVVGWKAAESADSEHAKPTGFLCPPDPAAWSDALRTLADSELSSHLSGTASLAVQMGDNGRAHVIRRFHFAEFQKQLVEHVASLLRPSGAMTTAAQGSTTKGE